MDEAQEGRGLDAAEIYDDITGDSSSQTFVVA